MPTIRCPSCGLYHDEPACPHCGSGGAGGAAAVTLRTCCACLRPLEGASPAAPESAGIGAHIRIGGRLVGPLCGSCADAARRGLPLPAPGDPPGSRPVASARSEHPCAHCEWAGVDAVCVDAPCRGEHRPDGCSVFYRPVTETAPGVAT